MLPIRSASEPKNMPGYLPAPMVFEPAEPQRWAYRVVRIDPREDEPLDETVLNSLGAEGWLLAGIIAPREGRELCYYFVRAAS